MARWSIEKQREWTKANHASVLAKRQEWRDRNREKLRERDREWRANNPEKLRRYRCKLQPLRTALQRKRHAAKLQATPAWADHEKINAVYAEAARLTRDTGTPYEVDHIYPLLGRDGSRGLHVHENLRIVLKQVNRRKSNRSPED